MKKKTDACGRLFFRREEWWYQALLQIRSQIKVYGVVAKRLKRLIHWAILFV